MINVSIISFKEIYNTTNYVGRLSAIEGCKDIPFSIERIYYITDVPNNIVRGYHSHTDLQQILICLNGSVKIRVSNTYEENVITLDSASKGLYIGPMIWREMFEFSKNSVLLVLASKHYDEKDYIRNYDEYKIIAKDYFN